MVWVLIKSAPLRLMVKTNVGRIEMIMLKKNMIIAKYHGLLLPPSTQAWLLIKLLKISLKFFIASIYYINKINISNNNSRFFPNSGLPMCFLKNFLFFFLLNWLSNEILLKLFKIFFIIIAPMGSNKFRQGCSLALTAAEWWLNHRKNNNWQ